MKSCNITVNYVFFIHWHTYGRSIHVVACSCSSLFNYWVESCSLYGDTMIYLLLCWWTFLLFLFAGCYEHLQVNLYTDLGLCFSSVSIEGRNGWMLLHLKILSSTPAFQSTCCISHPHLVVYETSTSVDSASLLLFLIKYYYVCLLWGIDPHISESWCQQRLEVSDLC